MSAAGRRPHLVTLQDDPDAGTPTVFSPATLHVSIEPASPGLGDHDHQVHVVTAPYHAQVNTDTTLVYGDRRLSVMGVQNLNERSREMVLYCEEVKTP